MLFGKPKGQASGPSTIMKSSFLREQRTEQPDLEAEENFPGGPSAPEWDQWGALMGKAEVQGRPVLPTWDTTTFSSAWISLEGPHPRVLP